MLGVLFLFGGVGWLAVFAAGLLIVGVAGFALAAFGLAVSVISLFVNYNKATKAKDMRWKVDIVLYPILGCGLGFVMPWFGLMSIAGADNIEPVPLRVVVILTCLYGMYLAPFVAFILLGEGGSTDEDERISEVWWRFLALPSFFLATYVWVSLGLTQGWWISPVA